jgi:hypothetical protein
MSSNMTLGPEVFVALRTLEGPLLGMSQGMLSQASSRSNSLLTKGTEEFLGLLSRPVPIPLVRGEGTSGMKRHPTASVLRTTLEGSLIRMNSQVGRELVLIVECLVTEPTEEHCPLMTPNVRSQIIFSPKSLLTVSTGIFLESEMDFGMLPQGPPPPIPHSALETLNRLLFRVTPYMLG